MVDCLIGMSTSNFNIIKIPFELVDQRIIVSCSVQGTKMSLLFDTGASNSFLTPETIKQLGLKQIADDVVTRTDGTKTKTPIYSLSRFSLESVELNDVKVLSTDLPFNLVCKGVKGFLGANIINALNWRINFDEKVIEISKSSFPAQGTICKVKYHKNNPIATLSINGKPFDFIIDFGYWGDLTMNIQELSKWQFIKSSKKALIVAQDVQNGKMLTLEKFNDYLLNDVVISNDLKLHEVVLSGWDMPVSFIGMAFLTRFNLTINSHDSSYFLYPRKNYSKKENTLLYNYGFKTSYNGMTLFASEYYPLSYQDASNVFSKEIIKVNGLSSEVLRKDSCKFNDFLSLLNARGEVEVTFSDGMKKILKKEFVKFE